MAAPRKKKLAQSADVVVTAGCVVAQDAAGAHLYFYEGAVLPETVPFSEKERLFDTGLVEVVAAPAVDEPSTESSSAS